MFWRPRGLLAAVLMLITLLCSHSGGRPRAVPEAAWRTGQPAINEIHIFEGEINRQGRPVGFHARPGGKDPRYARVVRIANGPNRVGVYDAQVEIYRPGYGQWLPKRSTFFPDTMDRQTVLAAILHAYQHRTSSDADKFRGPSGHGFTIEGYLLPNGAINTAYPIRQ